MIYVQNYVRVIGTDSKYFYTYNHSLDHPYFASRPGFVRAKMKYQGMVGVVGDGGKTRLTWLVNMDFGGLVPTSFMAGLLVSIMSFPIQVLEDTKEYVKKKEGEVTDITKSSPAKEEFIHKFGEGEEEEGEGKRESAAELKLKAELVEMKAEMAKKDEALRRKDEDHRIALTQKDKEIMELRRRRRRVVEEE
tara:strand:+ start:991 stop:1566 length:576 start_codon:yes stop_codon:yes gene_type:complete